MKTYIAITVAAFTLFGCQTTQFGKCRESIGSVSPACLYNGGYPACKLSDENYELAREAAWKFPEAQFSSETHVNTGQSQDLGKECRFYFYVKPELNPMEPYQWLVYVDKATLKPTRLEPVVW
jgi:hypothetical protein